MTHDYETYVDVIFYLFYWTTSFSLAPAVYSGNQTPVCRSKFKNLNVWKCHVRKRRRKSGMSYISRNGVTQTEDSEARLWKQASPKMS